MHEALYFILFAAGLVMVVKGSDWFVDSAVWAAEVFRIPSIIIGATIVSICTTLPETFVSAAAALKGAADMAVGNALGSIGVNIGFILAFLLIATRPSVGDRRELLKNGFFLAFLLATLWIAGMLFGEISRAGGAVLIFLFLLFIVNNVVSARKLMDPGIRYDIVDESEVPDNPFDSLPDGAIYDAEENDFNVSFQMIIRKIIFFIAGMCLVVFGSNLMVDNGIGIAEIFGVPSFMIAVIFTSAGTSLPEMVTVITSIRKGVCGLGIGNIIGASILNIIQVTGISALLLPIPVADEKSILAFQLPVLFIMVLSVIFLGLFSKGRLSRWGGVWLLALYAIFLTVNIMRGSAPILGPVLF